MPDSYFFFNTQKTMSKYTNIAAIISIVVLCTVSCSKDQEGNGGTAADSYDRGVMLADWADVMIVPALTAYQAATTTLQSAAEAYSEEPSVTTYELLRNQWQAAYTAWQSVAMYTIGPAEQLRLGNRTNIYPTNTQLIEANIDAESFNFELPSNMAAQGYPALEYLLYGDATVDVAQLANINSEENRKSFITALATDIATNATTVLQGWQDGYRDTFVAADGSSATASVNKLTNDYIYYFEKVLRANKVGIPAGIFSTEPLPQNVEGRFANGTSKTMLLAALDAFQHFFNGQYQTDTTRGNSYASYLDHLGNNDDLATDINNQLDAARAVAVTLDDDFEQQVITDNTKMLQLYDQLQKVVVLTKVDMMQALNIKVDYVDADGD